MKKTMIALLMPLALAACNGGGGGGHHHDEPGWGGNPGTPCCVMTHEELAREFVRRVNIELWGYDFSLAKANTQQYDYIVTHDNDHWQYDAYWIGDWNPGYDIASYIRRYQDRFYYGLEYIGFNEYIDPFTGLVFEKQNASSKNLAKLKAFKEQLSVAKAAENLQVTYGMSAEKSVDAARFAYRMHTSPAGTYSNQDFDAFSKELLGTSVTEFQSVAKSGDLTSLNEKIKLAAETTGMGVEGVNRLISDMFVQK